MTAPCLVGAMPTVGQRRRIRGISETATQSARVYAFPHPYPRRLQPEDILKQLSRRSWYKPTLKRLERFLSYGDDWDGYGAQKINERAVGRTMVILYLVALEGPDPVVVPLSHGGIQIEWYHNDTEVEVEVLPDGNMSIFIVHPDGGTYESTAITSHNHEIWSDLRTIIAGL